MHLLLLALFPAKSQTHVRRQASECCRVKENRLELDIQKVGKTGFAYIAFTDILPCSVEL